MDAAICSEFQRRSKSYVTNPYEASGFYSRIAIGSFKMLFMSNDCAHEKAALSEIQLEHESSAEYLSFVKPENTKSNMVLISRIKDKLFKIYRIFTDNVFFVLKILNRNGLFNVIKLMITRKIRVFNPILRKVKLKLIRNIAPIE